jgi:hypothetical protein
MATVPNLNALQQHTQALWNILVLQLQPANFQRTILISGPVFAGLGQWELGFIMTSYR